MYVSWSEFLSLFLWSFLLLFGYNYCDWLYVYSYVSFLFLFFAFIRTSLDFSFFLFVCLWMSVPLSSYIKLWLIVSAYTSLLRVSYSLSLWISVLVFGGYIVTHCTCICSSLDPCFSLSFLWMLLSFFGNIVTDCPYIVLSLDMHFCLCFSLAVSICAYSTANSACICTSLYPCFSLLPDR